MNTETKITHAEAHGREPFDWNKFLAETHDDDEWEAAVELSGQWTTCACGNQCDIIPRMTPELLDENSFIMKAIGEPMDSQLSQLGIDFHKAIGRKNVHWAKQVLAEIEDRSSELLFAILSSSNNTDHVE
ncbi:hypothetical protein [Hymenobacter siberiensis]|uniref:hypothetical protein n=1 Tax=Hymenobacter siberiensis TaxID=2848396 RepID=UPI001C1E37F2|nr:hypothetical protein [Hymenobacter siberiensis]